MDRARIAYLSTPQGARPALNPNYAAHHTTPYLDHNVWHAPPPDAPIPDSLRPQSIPLSRSRSAQHLIPSSSQTPYYEDYIDDRHAQQSPSRWSAYSEYYPSESEATPSNYDQTQWRFPEPRILQNGSTSTATEARSNLAPQPSHRHSRSENATPYRSPYNNSETSFDTAAALADMRLDDEPQYSESEVTPSIHSRELNENEQQQELLQDGIIKFQEGTLPEADNEWHRLVSEEFRLSLPKSEIQRQSTIFEVIKSEKDYVHDLELVEQVFINPLMEAQPPVITPSLRLRTFRNEVFQNITDILARHRVSLAALFERQRDQHPLISTIADIELDAALSAQQEYEAYIKQYPIAEGRHRREMKSNSAYAAFIHKASKDPRLRKRDLITFISRPVTRLPRISLILEHIYKLTDPEHPDIETMPLTLNILKDFVKSTQPGVAVADAKVKFWALCESLVYRPGEIIDMDLYDAQRHLIHTGTVARRNRVESGYGWRDAEIALLDNYFMVTSVEVRMGRTFHVLVSRPIPLDCLGLGSFTDSPEYRREEREHGSIRLLNTLTMPSHPVYPFTVYHKLDMKRRYTFYAPSEAVRKKWYDTFIDALGVRKAQQDVNKWFAPDTLDDGTFRSRTARVPSSSRDLFAGRITSAATFSDNGRKYIAVACASGLYAAVLTGAPDFKKILSAERMSSILSLSKYGKLIVLQDDKLLSYNSRVLVDVIKGIRPLESFAGSVERLTGRDVSVSFFGAGDLAGRSVVVYATKGFRQTTMVALEAVSQPPTSGENRMQGNADPVTTFRPYGSPFYVPRDAYNVSVLAKTLGISTSAGIAIIEPTHISSSEIRVVPDWNEGPIKESLQARVLLKDRCDDSRPLGLMQSGESELLMVYESFGCYITKNGAPARKSGFVRWETQVQSFVAREPHVLLVGQYSIEVRHAPTGRLLQIIEGQEMRLVQKMPRNLGPTLIARRGKKDDDGGLSDQLVELVETAPIVTSDINEVNLIWEEWGV